jgi:phosphoribosylglycinamide formyltransferase-1
MQNHLPDPTTPPKPTTRQPIVVLISGRGSNLQALIDEARPAYDIACVISNRPGAYGLERAKAAGITTAVLDHTQFSSRDAFDAALAALIDTYSPSLVVLAGFMRVLTSTFVEHYAGRLINIHPSLLPAFPGLKTHEQAINSGVKLHGATVHFVTPALDHGPIISQGAVPVMPGDTPQALAERVLELEHQLFPRAVNAFCEGLLTVDGLAVRWATEAQAALLVHDELKN